MSFSWWCKDKDGKDLFKEFGVNPQALGLGPNTEGATEAEYELSAIRAAFTRIPYTEKFEDAARDAIAIVQQMALENKESLKEQPHCSTCTCAKRLGYLVPTGWDIEEINRLLAIPLERVWRCGGGW